MFCLPVVILTEGRVAVFFDLKKSKVDYKKKKCVRVLAQSFQSFVGKDESFPESVKNLISASYDPIYKFHQGFLKEVEQRLAQWSVCVCLFLPIAIPTASSALQHRCIFLGPVSTHMVLLVDFLKL